MVPSHHPLPPMPICNYHPLPQKNMNIISGLLIVVIYKWWFSSSVTMQLNSPSPNYIIRIENVKFNVKIYQFNKFIQCAKDHSNSKCWRWIRSHIKNQTWCQDLVFEQDESWYVANESWSNFKLQWQKKVH
jgi:hypothetical protein